MFQEISRCRICGNTQLVEVLDLGTQALAHVFPRTEAQRVPAAPLRLMKCTGEPEVCGLLQLKHTYMATRSHGADHAPRPVASPCMLEYRRRIMLKALQRARVPHEALIVDTGGNGGTTLPIGATPGCVLAQFNAADAEFAHSSRTSSRLIPGVFSASSVRHYFGSRKASVIASFSTFYGLEDPLGFMQEIVEVLDDNGICVTELGYMPAMLRMNAYDTVYHDQLAYYALRQFKWMTDRVGLTIVDLEVDGSRFCMMIAKKGSRLVEHPGVATLLDEEARSGLHTLEPYLSFARHVTASKATLKSFFDGARRAGRKIAALGASTSANRLLQYCNVTATDLTCIGEVNPHKFQTLTPGTLIPIVSEEESLAAMPDYLIVLPWRLRDHFLAQRRFVGRSLIFPLPQLELVCVSSSSHTAVEDAHVDYGQ